MQAACLRLLSSTGNIFSPPCTQFTNSLTSCSAKHLLFSPNMDKGKGRESWRTPRRAQPKRQTPRKQSQPQGRQHEGPKQWEKATKMASAKAQVNEKRVKASSAGEGDYSGQPPSNLELIKVSSAHIFSCVFILSDLIALSLKAANFA